MNRFYSKDGVFGPSCEAATKTFGETITAFANSGKRVLRILEVGAGKFLWPPGS